MSYSSELTKERILKCAKDEFLQNGFINANIRVIANNAKATTGAIYNHYKSKSGLHEAIVGKFAAELLELFDIVHSEVPSDLAFETKAKDEGMANGTAQVLGFVYEHLEEAKILFFLSTGTKYERYVDRLIEIEEQASLKELVKENFEITKTNRFFLHVMATSGINNMLSVIEHDLTKEEAFEYLEMIHRFYYAGTKEILGV